MCMMSDTSVVPGLYMGGLRNDIPAPKLAGLICSLLWKCQVPKKNIRVNKKPTTAFALIDLPDEETARYLMCELKNVANILDLTTITFNPSDLRVAPRRTPSSNRNRSRSQRRKIKREKAAAEASQKAALTSVSDHCADSSGAVSSRSGRPLQKNQDEHAKRFRSASYYRTNRNQSNTSLHGSNDGSSSDSGAESDDASNSNPSVKKVESNSTVSSKESDERLPDGGPNFVQRGYYLMAGGVRRLAQEFAADGVRQSVSDSDRSMYAPMVKKSATTSTTGLPTPGLVSVTTSTPGTGTGLAIGFYRLGENVGRESRHSEFKQGGHAHKDRSWLQETVGKYACGFLNSAEGGTLYIGVNDNGMVSGFSCPQNKEDNFRLLIDEALKSIEPPIFTDSYAVRFVLVMESNGKLSESLRVLEIEVKEIKHLKHLYDFRGNAYLRRDGSLQGPLKARHVQELTRKLLERENSGSLLKSHLREMTTQLEKEREKNADMKQQLTELEGYISELTSTLESYGHRFVPKREE
ncbi:uncharacterized protein [Littorina saxatilis]|uniref:uncharacterized protein isoform X2 n=1 Tax=Littorina saxatilis TaxID=31220 RepID=UPI0038B68EE2